jgi:hypothetical protein
MPATSEKMRVAAAIAEHEPGKLYKRNRGFLKMTHGQLHDFAVKPKRKRKWLKGFLRRKRGK